LPQNPLERWKPPAEWYVVLEGVPKNPADWHERQPGEDAVMYMFRVFPVVRLN
jgi:hypothetical protein